MCFIVVIYFYLGKKKNVFEKFRILKFFFYVEVCVYRYFFLICDKICKFSYSGIVCRIFVGLWGYIIG